MAFGAVASRVLRYLGFLGPTARTQASTLDTERTINGILERTDAGLPLADPRIDKRMGAQAWIDLNDGPVRGVFQQDGRAFAVTSTQFSEVFANQTYIVRGTVPNDPYPSSIAQNSAQQIMVQAGGLGFIFDTSGNTFVEITDAEFEKPPIMITYIDEYFFSLHSTRVQFSALSDGMEWDGTDFLDTSFSSDNKIAMFANHRELWLFGTKHTEVWANTGNLNTPFQPIPGVFIEHGIVAPWSVAKLDNTIFWLSGDERGRGTVMRADGFRPQRISSHAIDQYIQEADYLTDAVGFAFQENGHGYYVLYIPQIPVGDLGSTSIVYDVSNNQWTEWSLWSETLGWHLPFLGVNHMYAFGKHLVGSRIDSGLYWMHRDFMTDKVLT